MTIVNANTTNEYLIGNSTVITVNITKDTVLSDPILLMFEYKKPDGTITTFNYGQTSDIVKVSTGVYNIVVKLTQEGLWKYRWESTSPNSGAVEGSILVTASIL